jgi:hypothetical protein
VRAIRLATLDDLVKAPGMNRKAATQVADYFAQRAQLEGGDPELDDDAPGEGIDEVLDDEPGASDAEAESAAPLIEAELGDDDRSPEPLSRER